MPPRKTTPTRRTKDRLVEQPKPQAWLRKLMAALEVPSDAREVVFKPGDPPTVSWK